MTGKVIRSRIGSAFFIALPLLFPAVAGAQGISAAEIVKRADEKFRGEKSSYSVMAMQIVRPDWTRTIEFKSWSLGDDYALALITAPARESGQSFLKRLTEMWSWNPSINRLIKLPPSILLGKYLHKNLISDKTAELLKLRQYAMTNTIIEGLGEEKVTFIFSTHDPRVMKMARRVITLEDGMVVSDERRNG